MTQQTRDMVYSAVRAYVEEQIGLYDRMRAATFTQKVYQSATIEATKYAGHKALQPSLDSREDLFNRLGVTDLSEGVLEKLLSGEDISDVTVEGIGRIDFAGFHAGINPRPLNLVVSAKLKRQYANSGEAESDIDKYIQDLGFRVLLRRTNGIDYGKGRFDENGHFAVVSKKGLYRVICVGDENDIAEIYLDFANSIAENDIVPGTLLPKR